MDWVKFYPGRFEIGTRHLSAEEVGFYIRLLCAQALKGDLPTEFEKLSRIAGGMSQDAWEAIEDKFPIVDGVRINPRMNETIEEAERATEAARAAGRKGGLARAAKASKGLGDPSSSAKQKDRKTDKENVLQWEAGSDIEHMEWSRILSEEFGVDRARSFTFVTKLRERKPGQDGRVWFSSCVDKARKARSPRAYFAKCLKEEFGL